MVHVHVFLYSTMDDEGNLEAMLHSMTVEEAEMMYFALENNLRFIPFGKFGYNAEDIARYRILEDGEQPYKNM